jgi:hypothetical protein
MAYYRVMSLIWQIHFQCLLFAIIFLFGVKKEYPVLRLAVNILIDVEANDPIRTQIFTELGRRHYFTGNFTETT